MDDDCGVEGQKSPQILAPDYFNLPLLRSDFIYFLSSAMIYLLLLYFIFILLAQSSYPTRMNRCKEILKKAVSLNASFGKFIGDANRLTDKLVELCNKPVGYTLN